MAKVKFEFNKDQIGLLLSDPAIIDFLDTKSNNAVAELGKGYKAKAYERVTKYKSVRPVRVVAATTKRAARENMETNSILKAVFGG